MEYIFLEVKRDEMLKALYTFRYHIIKETPHYKEYFEQNHFPDKQEHDRYDPYAIHLAALNSHNEIVAAVRLIHHSPLGYPMEHTMLFDHAHYQRMHLGELSRIFIDKRYRNMHATKSLIEGLKTLIYQKLITLDIDYTYGALEKRFVRLLRMFNMPYDIIGNEQIQKGMGLRLPCILKTKQLAHVNQDILHTQENRYV